MRNLSLFLVFSFLFSFLHAQDPPEISVDSMMVNIDQSDFTSGILYDRVYDWAGINTFNDSVGISNASHFEQSLLELYQASNGQKFTSHKDLRMLYTPDSLQHIVDIGILNASYHRLNYREGSVNEGGLDLIDDQFEKINNSKPAFLSGHTFIVAPLKWYAAGDAITFRFTPDFFLQDTEGKQLISLTADFDGSGTNYTVFENGIFPSETFTITFAEAGLQELLFTAVFEDGTSLTTKGALHVRQAVAAPPMVVDGSLDADIPFQGYDESSAIFGKVQYRIFYHTNNGNQAILQKPIVIIDGFDPGDIRKIQDSDPHPGLSNYEHVSIEEMMSYTDSQGVKRYLIPLLRNLGYDVVIVNHPNYWRNGVKYDGGADFIERNAMAHVKLYQHLNAVLTQNNSNEELVIVGPSMGGQISRYALAYMEKNGIPHNTRLWVSIDSPHLGANIPVGDQTLLHLLNDYTPSVAAEDYINEQLGSPAAKQQLIERHKTVHVGLFGQSLTIGQEYLNGRTISQGFNENRGHPFFKTYYNNLFNNGLAGSNGYPQNLRKIAMVNGSLLNTKSFINPFEVNGTGTISNPYSDVYAYNTAQTLKLEGMTNGIGHSVTMETYFMPNTNANHKIAFFKKKGLNGWNFHDRYVNNYNSRGNLDNVPGGWFPTQQALAAEIENSSSCEWFIGQVCINDWSIENLKHVNSFIPTISALGFYAPDMNWNQNLDRNLVCTNEIPFDSYFGPKTNERHTSFTEASVNWLLEELAGNPQPPTVYLNENDLNGPDIICGNDMVTYDFDTCMSPPVMDWEVSPNLQIVTSTDFSVIVSPVSSTTNGPGFVKAVYSNHQLEKEIWIGKPGAPSFLNGPTEVHTGSMVSYNGGGSPGATAYKWILPYPFDENIDIRNPINLNSDHWQMWPTTSPHNSHIFTGLGGHDGLVQLIGENSCGTGGSINMEVEHTTGGSCPTCYEPVTPYPNEADESFTLDFSEYPPGNYYIYVYDANSTIWYEGSSTNIEKTVETLSIPEGLYYLHVHDGNEVIIKQLIISH